MIRGAKEAGTVIVLCQKKDGVGYHIEKGYIYAAMAFAVLVEAVNIFAKARKAARGGVKHHATAGNLVREQVAAHKPLRSRAKDAGRDRGRRLDVRRLRPDRRLRLAAPHD